MSSALTAAFANSGFNDWSC